LCVLHNVCMDVQIKPYVHVTYLPTHSAEELGRKMRELAESPNAPYFLEATIYSQDKAVIQMGEFCDKPTSAADRAKINGINWWWKPFYYKWVETFLEKGQADEFIPLMDYYHRFTR
jgi:Delta24-sterol reductase